MSFSSISLRTADEDALLLERLDQREDAAHVATLGGAHTFEGLGGHHRAHAVAGEELAQERAVVLPRDQVGARDTALARGDRCTKVALDVVAEIVTGMKQLLGFSRRELCGRHSPRRRPGPAPRASR